MYNLKEFDITLSDPTYRSIENPPAFAPCSDWLALDFDGVIVDSIEECLVVGYNAAQDYSGRPTRILRLRDISPAQVAYLRALRNFVRTGEDYVYCSLALFENQPLSHQNAFDTYVENHAASRAHLRDLFYRHRQQLLVEQPAHWIQLNPLFPPILKWLQESSKVRVSIVTTKKAAYVARILTAHKIDFPPFQIYSTEKGRHKSEILAQLQKNFGQNSGHWHFVDDQVDTLLKIHLPRVWCYLAGWGYVNDEQVALARRSGITILTLPDFVSRFRFNH